MNSNALRKSTSTPSNINTTPNNRRIVLYRGFPVDIDDKPIVNVQPPEKSTNLPSF